MSRTSFYADPSGRFVHQPILDSCRRVPHKIAIIDTSCGRRISYAEYGEMVESLAHGFVAAGLNPGEVIAIYLANSWEFCATFHAASLCGAVVTLLNPSYREREVHHQLENSGAVFLVTDGACIQGMNLSGLPNLRRVFTTRSVAAGSEVFSRLLTGNRAVLPGAVTPPEATVAALPYSSGTTGLPKGVMLSHTNLIANVFQFIGPDASELNGDDRVLCFLPLYHIYGLNVMLNPTLTLGATLVLMPRFDAAKVGEFLLSEHITMMPLVPPAMNALTQAAEAGQFPAKHTLRWVKSGAAPLAGDLARRFTALTGVLVCQGYGMTEASPVTHVGYLEPQLYRPDSIGQPLAKTDCRVVDDEGIDLPPGQAGELVMRGPQFMMGYWNEPQATASVVRDGWYWSGDIVSRDENEFYSVLDRRKEMIKYKGFPVAPAEVEAVLLEHPAVRECGVVGRADAAAGEVPVAFVALRAGIASSTKLGDELCAFVAERITSYKQPREVRFVDAVPKTASGKILRRELRAAL
jgi:long-chain acyl-CoA synthetase